jgi:hypothetical protein
VLTSQHECHTCNHTSRVVASFTWLLTFPFSIHTAMRLTPTQARVLSHANPYKGFWICHVGLCHVACIHGLHLLRDQYCCPPSVV